MHYCRCSVGKGGARVGRTCDVVVVGLHLSECFLVVLHQVVDVLVLALLHLVHLHSSTQLQVGLQLRQPTLAAGNQLRQSVVELLSQLDELLLVLLSLRRLIAFVSKKDKLSQRLCPRLQSEALKRNIPRRS